MVFMPRSELPLNNCRQRFFGIGSTLRCMRFVSSNFFWIVALPAVSFAASMVPPHRYDHVVVVIEENTSFQEVIGNRTDAPYINQLADEGTSFTEFYGITHPSQPNYLHFFSGDNQGVTDDSYPTGFPWSTPNLGAEIIAAGFTWGSYAEDLPAIGDATTERTPVDGSTPRLYRRRHCPWTNWQATAMPVPANQIPPSTNQRFLDFPATFTQLPALSFVIPNMQHNMHDGTTRMADDWLRTNLSAYADWATTHNGLLIVTFDEDNFSDTNKIPTVFRGAGIVPGRTIGSTWTLHNLLRTLEDMWGTSHAGRSNNVRAISGVFPEDPPVLLTNFRQGLDGYSGVSDTTIRADQPSTSLATAHDLSCDLDIGAAAGTQPAQILVRFRNLFGSGAGQVPPDATILSAKLRISTGPNSSDGTPNLIEIHRMLTNWNDAATWSNTGNGIAQDDVESVITPSFDLTPVVLDAPAIFDVTSDVEIWKGGAANYGWVFISKGADGWVARSSEVTSDQTKRPTLEIVYTPAQAAGFAAWQQQRFGSNAGQPIAAARADPDGDGVLNLMEYALDSDPLRALPAARPVVGSMADRVPLTFRRNLLATDVTLRVEASDTLDAGTWTTLATRIGSGDWVAVPGIAVNETLTGVVTITAPPPEAPDGRRFFRLVVER